MLVVPIAGQTFFSFLCFFFLFLLPMVSSREFFRPLRFLKVDKRSSLGNDLLDDLLVLNTDRIPLKDFNPDHNISLWSSEKTRRPNQGPRKKYSKHREEDVEQSEDGHEVNFVLDEWDNWMDAD